MSALHYAMSPKLRSGQMRTSLASARECVISSGKETKRAQWHSWSIVGQDCDIHACLVSCSHELISRKAQPSRPRWRCWSGSDTLNQSGQGGTVGRGLLLPRFSATLFPSIFTTKRAQLHCWSGFLKCTCVALPLSLEIEISHI